MKIGFIRHGTTAWNLEGRAQGSSDIPLDERGNNDALALAKRLVGKGWSHIYSSDLKRARETAEIIVNKACSVGLEIDARLREVGGGQIEGTTEEERVTKWGMGWRELELGIEKREFVITRALGFLNVIETHTAANNNVLVVSHGAFLKQLITEIVPDEKVDGTLANTSLTILSYEDGRWKIDSFNDIGHVR